MSIPAPATMISPITSGRGLRERSVGQRGTSKAPTATLLKWIDALETGNAEIDALHRNLVDNCNSLLKSLVEDAAWPLIIAKTKSLVEDCVEHFRIEQAILEQIDFPREKAHAEEHRRFERDLRALVARMEQLDGSLREHRELPETLGPSIIDLMVRHDLDYRSHLLHRQGL